MKKIFTIIATFILLVSYGCGSKEQTTPEQIDAPKVTSSTPADGETDVPEGSLEAVIVFDQNIKCSGEGVTIDEGASVEKVFAYNTSLKINISGLVCEKTYTLTIPEGIVTGFKENQKASSKITVRFTTEDGPLTPPEPGTAPDGWENSSAAVLNMGTGWNLGNTMDSNGDWIVQYTAQTPSDWETAWGQPVTKPELIKMFAQAGFGAIRVPVTWKEHFAADNTINEAWMARVEEIVGYVLDAGMYCILNSHHDTGTEGWLHASSSNYAQNSEKYKKMWQQIATRFEKYGNRLIFESFNEMLDNSNNWGNPSDDAVGAINSYNADFVATVRSTGGNNAKRNLILNTYAANVESNSLNGFTVPTDSAQDHLIAEFHSYAPYRFAFHQEDSSQQLSVFDDACKSEVESIINRAAAALHAKGLPCIIGEYGSDSAVASDTELGKQAACYVSTAKANSMACFYWMGLSDGEDRSVPKWTKPVIKDAILKAYK